MQVYFSFDTNAYFICSVAGKPHLFRRLREHEEPASSQAEPQQVDEHPWTGGDGEFGRS